METTGQYLSSRFVVKCSKRLSLTISTNILLHIHLHVTTKNQSGFRPGDSTTNQLIDLVDEINQAFDSKKPLEVRAVFLGISKAFDVWHDGLTFKMRQNGISGNLLKLFQNYLSNRKQRVSLMVSHLITLASILGPWSGSWVPHYFLSTLMILRSILNRM